MAVAIGEDTGHGVVFDHAQPFGLIAGTCAIETRETTFRTAEFLQDVCARLGIGLVYKGSFDKANRTSTHGARGLGLEEGLRVLEDVRRNLGIPVLTDVHEVAQASPVGQVVDVLQIPAFLSRQTDLLVACAQTGKAVNIKKAQFMAPPDVVRAAEKVADAGNKNILLTERGTSFGYNNLVVDFRAFPQMAASGYPVIFDATHSVMEPSARGDASGGRREFVPPLCRAALGMGLLAGLFVETHPDPANAISDRETQLPLEDMPDFLARLKRLDDFAKGG
jgi:2-dehydro-3-deoxyphosphooctonate aldolase (KDO 8-P synthase)